MPASNTEDCFREFIGQKCIGALMGQLRIGGGDFSGTLVFEDGRGLSFYESGAFTVTRAADIASAVRHRQQQLEKTQRDREAVVQLAGKLPEDHKSKKSAKSGKKR